MQTLSLSNKLYEMIQAAFCVIVVISNIISAKMFTLPFFDFSIPAGLITYPLTFLLSDLTTEIFGAQKAKSMVFHALGMTLLSYAIIQFSLMLPSSDPLQELAYQSVLGLNGIIIFASLTAYVIAQILDIQLYALIKRWTGEKHLWLRNNGSTLISQIADTITVNTIHLHFGLGLDMATVMQIMLFSYIYKATFSVLNTPLFYLGVYLIKKKTEPENIFAVIPN